MQQTFSSQQVPSRARENSPFQTSSANMLKIIFCFFILLTVAICPQASADEWTDYIPADEQDLYNYEVNKRSLSSLAKNNLFPSKLGPVAGDPYRIPKRNVPPLLSAYRGVLAEAKRYLGALARNGDLNKRKKYTNMPSSDAPDDLEARRMIADSQMMKAELVENLKPILLEYINEMGMRYEYDPRKVDLFLENLANAMFDRNEEFTMDHIKSLVKTGYFQREIENGGRGLDQDEEQKRNIQSLAREYNVSFAGGANAPSSGHHSGQRRYYPTNEPKRNLASVARAGGYYKRLWDDDCDYPAECQRQFAIMAKNYDVRTPSPAMPLSFWPDSYPQLVRTVPARFVPAKRHTMYDIDEPAANEEYSSSDAADYSDYSEQQDAIPVGKRYLGSLAKSGWLPRGFTVRSSRASDYEKRHIGALARFGWQSNGNSKDMNRYYLRGGRDPVLPDVLPAPKRLYLSAGPDLGRCQCKRAPLFSRWSPWTGSHFTGRYAPPGAFYSVPFPARSYYTWPRQTIMRRQRQPQGKRYLLMPAVDNFIFRNLYPHLLRQ